MDAVIVRILTDVSAMLPSSGYTRPNTVKNVKTVKILSMSVFPASDYRCLQIF